MSVFETRQRAKELLDEAIKIWKQSPQSESLEGLEKDPVMSLLMSAIAYQANETDSEIERIKEDVLAEYIHALTPYELGHAVPATAVVEASLKKSASEQTIDSGCRFKLSGGQYEFMPVLRTKVIAASVQSISRIDGRRWRVTIQFGSPVSDLSGFTFAIRNSYFKDLKVSYKGYYIPLLKPWDYSRLPLAKCFSMDAALYNGSQSYNPALVGMELFARQNVRLFCVRSHDSSPYMSEVVDELNLVFEFTGISSKFVFDKKQLVLNSILLAETTLNTTTLSYDQPVVRIAGCNDSDGQGKACSQFLHLIRPDDVQIYGNERVEVRRIAADRFNQASLLRLLNSLINKYQSDFYAFLNNRELIDDGTIHTLQDILGRLVRVCRNDKERNAEGVYLILHSQKSGKTNDEPISLEISFLTTHGANVNDQLNEKSTFLPPPDIDMELCRQIAVPMPGCNEVGDTPCEQSLMRYHVITNDRIVTPADIKAFCYNELMTRYGIDSNMVGSVQVGRGLDAEQACGYEITTDIVIKNNSFVKRSFADHIPQVEQLLEKMMEVRSASVYPIKVTITIEGN